MTSPMPSLRDYNDATDREKVISLWRSVFGYEAAHNEPSISIAKKLNANDHLFFVAEDQNSLVGLAIWYAEAFVADHKSIEPSQISVLRENFTDAELVELVAFVSFMWAGGTCGKVLGIQPQYDQVNSGNAMAQSSASAV